LKILKSNIIFVNKTITTNNITKLSRFHINVNKKKSIQKPTARYIIATNNTLVIGLILVETIKKF
jgi:hypothetical protein